MPSAMLAFSLMETPMFKFLAIILACIGAAGAARATLVAPLIDTIAGRRVESITVRHPSSQDIVVDRKSVV